MRIWQIIGNLIEPLAVDAMYAWDIWVTINLDSSLAQLFEQMNHKGSFCYTLMPHVWRIRYTHIYTVQFTSSSFWQKVLLTMDKQMDDCEYCDVEKVDKYLWGEDLIYYKAYWKYQKVYIM